MPKTDAYRRSTVVRKLAEKVDRMGALKQQTTELVREIVPDRHDRALPIHLQAVSTLMALWSLTLFVRPAAAGTTPNPNSSRFNSGSGGGGIGGTFQNFYDTFQPIVFGVALVVLFYTGVEVMVRSGSPDVWSTAKMRFIAVVGGVFTYLLAPVIVNGLSTI